MAGKGKVINFAELSQHSTSQDCWLLIDGKVYDVTKFLNDHPGGDDLLLLATGKDATREFEEVGHSSSAKTMLNEFYVGDIDSTTKASDTVAATTTTPNQTEQNHDKKNSELFSMKNLQFLVPILMLGLALGGFYIKTPSP
ncbi:hypothetical protein AALP_AA3G077400 [Arabis alpina]|uniref:Cytochrome b5 heme-binding domain-containing protein n=1 Tax=Arabis alpina TaxID=50452 RepID=A0A087H7R2_ARAAL|nr:hypothetical protein AALP_AA3G077400 [Arabis alpina]